MTMDSRPELLTLHAVRLKGFADAGAIADRFQLEPVATQEELEDAEARGWVERIAFADLAGWTLTAAGRAENERQLRIELGRAGGHKAVGAAYEAFLPLNARLLRACTDWQLKPDDGSRLSPNNHADRDWDDAVLHELGALNRAIGPLVGRLAGILSRFCRYDVRFSAALARAHTGEHGWVDRTDIDSCHRVWFELHEDFVATLGIDRRVESNGARP